MHTACCRTSFKSLYAQRTHIFHLIRNAIDVTEENARVALPSASVVQSDGERTFTFTHTHIRHTNPGLCSHTETHAPEIPAIHCRSDMNTNVFFKASSPSSGHDVQSMRGRMRRVVFIIPICCRRQHFRKGAHRAGGRCCGVRTSGLVFLGNRANATDATISRRRKH